MPYGGNDWLALTQEPTLEPELPICDPHHHFWDRRLQSLPYQRYLLDELHADISSGHNVRSTVFLEARSMYRPDGPVEHASRRGGGIRPGAGGGECQWDLRPQPSGRRHHRPCRLEARGQRGAGPGRVTGGQPQPVSGHPAQRHLESRPRGGQPGERGHPGQRHLPGRGEGLAPQGVVPGCHDLVSPDAGSGRLRQGRAGCCRSF